MRASSTCGAVLELPGSRSSDTLVQRRWHAMNPGAEGATIAAARPFPQLGPRPRSERGRVLHFGVEAGIQYLQSSNCGCNRRDQGWRLNPIVPGTPSAKCGNLSRFRQGSSSIAIRAQASASDNASWWFNGIPKCLQTFGSAAFERFKLSRAISMVHRNS